MRRLLALLLALLAALPPVASPAWAITGGAADGGTHPYVGVVFNAHARCTGTLISPTVVLTAGHCTRDFVADRSPVYAAFDPAPGADSDTYAGTPHTDPAFVPADESIGGQAATDDVGVVVLDQPVALAAYGALPAAGAVEALVPGDPSLTAVGYGVQRVPRAGSPEATDLGTRAAAALALADDPGAVGHGFLELATGPGRDGGRVCYGDSGGPLLLTGTATVLAVVSFGTDVRCRGASYAARIDTPSTLAFVGQFLAGATARSIREGVTVVVTDDGVRLRASPSTAAPIVAELPQGRILEVTGPATGGGDHTWWPVRDPANPDLVGYVAAEFLQVQP